MTTEDQIIEQENKLLSVVRAMDAEGLALLLHDELLFNLPNGETGTKALDLEAYRSGQMKVDEITPSDRLIRILKEDTASVAVTIQLRASWFGQAIDGKFRYLRVWQKHDGRWQIVAGSCAGMG